MLKGLSCKRLLTKFNILFLASELLVSLQSFVVDNMEKLQTTIHSINSRHEHDLHMLNANLTSYQKGAYYVGIKLFNTLPPNIIMI
jgi:hypothetical protein